MNKVVLITGGTRGIGLATVKLFHQKGWQVVFCYTNSRDKAAELLAECPGCEGIACDVADPAAVARMFAKIEQDFGRLDALVCNAGVALPQQLLTDLQSADYRRLMGVNVDGTLYCAKEAARLMVKHHAGSIVTLSSVWGVVGGSCEVAYSASKGAIIALTKALAKELGPSNIRVNCVAPGVIDTDMNGHLSKEDKEELKDQIPLMRLGRPEDVAGIIEFLCQEPAGYITGQVIGVDGGM